MKRRLVFFGALAAVAGNSAMAQGLNDQIVTTLQDMGFTRIEIETGLTQTKVEALRSDVKLEVVYDQETGRIITQEQDRVDADDDTTPGIEISQGDEDFVDETGEELDDDDEDEDDLGDEDEDGDDEDDGGDDDHDADDHDDDDRDDDAGETGNDGDDESNSDT